MKRTASSSNASTKTGTDLNATMNFRNYNSNFVPENDSKSKNILAWAGRVKELIGTYDQKTDGGMGQLTRATGYSNLLAACGVDDSGDVQSRMRPRTKSDPKPTNGGGANSVPAKTQVTGAVPQRKPSKENEKLEQQTTTEMTPSMVLVPLRTEGQQEVRRTYSSHDRGRTDLPDAQQKPVARRASQSEVKTPPAPVRDASYIQVARPESWPSPVVPDKRSSSPERAIGGGWGTRRVVDRKESKESTLSSDFDAKRRTENSAAARSPQRNLPPAQPAPDPLPTSRSPPDRREQTPPSASRKASPINSDNVEQNQSRGRPATPSSDDEPKPAPARSFKHNEANEEVKKDLNKVATKDASKGAATPVPRRAAASRNSYENVQLEPASPTQSNESYLPEAENRRPTRAARVPERVDSDPTDSQQRARYTPAARQSRSSEVEPVNTREARPQMLAKRSRERSKPTYDAVEENSSIESLSQFVTDFDLRRKTELAEHSKKSELLRQRARELERYRQEFRASADLEESDTSISLSEKASDIVVGRRAEYPVAAPAPPRRASPASQRIPDTSLDLRGVSRDFSLPAKSSANLDDIESIESGDLTTRRRPEYPDAARPRRASPASQKTPDTPASQKIPDTPSNVRDSSAPVKGRRRLKSEGGSGVNKSKSDAKDVSTPTKQRTSSAESPCPRPILRNPAAAHGPRQSVQKGKSSPSVAPRRPSPSPTPPALHARPAVPPKRTPAVRDDDADDDDNFMPLRRTGRGLGKVAAVTDLSDDRKRINAADLSIAPPRSNRHHYADRNASVKTPPRNSIRPMAAGLTPRKIWDILHPVVLRFYQLFVLILDHIKLMIDELFCHPDVAASYHRMGEIGMGVMESWTLLFAVVVSVGCLLMVIILS